MKKSELRKMISEEIRTILNEDLAKAFDKVELANNSFKQKPTYAFNLLAEVIQGVLQELSNLKQGTTK